MPLQSAFTLGIIAGCFCTMGGLLRLINTAYEGKPERAFGQSYWQHRLGERDMAINKVYRSNID